MCSTCDCDTNTVSNRNDNLTTISDIRKCRKCGSDPFIVLDKIHLECRTCFLESCNKKIRSTIGKSRLLKNGDAILIASSGGASSMALLDLLKNSMESEARREQKFRPSIIHIDTYSVSSEISDLNQIKPHRCSRLKLVLDSMRQLCPNWPIYWTTLETCAINQAKLDPSNLYSMYDGDDIESSHLLTNVEAFAGLKNATKSLDLTDQQHYYENSIVSLIDVVASSLSSSRSPSEQFKFVLQASTASQLANNLLVNVILGKGSTIHSTVNFCDPTTSVPVVRPLRDFSKKEIVFYLKARNLEFNVQMNLVTMADKKANIQKSTEAFLSKLYIDYPSTYYTLLRTGIKMQN